MKKITLKIKLLISGILIALIPLSIAGTFSIFKASDAINGLSEKQSLIVARTLSDLTDEFLFEEIKLAESISVEPEIVEASTLNIRGELDSERIQKIDNHLSAVHKKLGKDYDQFFISDNSGIAVFNSIGLDAKKVKISVAERDYFKDIKAGKKVSIGSPVLSKVTGKPVIVISVPVKTLKNEFAGILGIVVQLKSVSDKILKIRIGNTGYPFLVDNNGNVAAHPNKDLILKKNINSIEGMESVAKIINERKSTVVNYSYDGLSKISAVSHSDISDWSVVVTQDRSEFMAPIYNIRNFVLIIGAVSLLLTIIGMIFFVRDVMSQLGQDPAEIARIADSIANGNLNVEFNNNGKKVVGVYKNMEIMTGNLTGMLRDISNAIETLSSSSTELSTISKQMAAGSEQTSEKAFSVSSSSEELATSMTSVAAATEQTTANLQMIVSAAEEMSVTINEIAGNTSKGNRTTADAVSKAKEISNKVSELGIAASEISKVTETISDISDQTNLLALNATIEAARAGDSGKGFAVVAGEIKNLAQETAQATDEISLKISNVQKSTEESVTAISEIVEIINEINNIVTSVSTAIEEQSSTTHEISSNVSQAAEGVQEVNVNINQVSSVGAGVTRDIAEVSNLAGEMKTGSNQIDSSALELSKLAENLNEMIKRFKL